MVGVLGPRQRAEWKRAALAMAPMDARDICMVTGGSELGAAADANGLKGNLVTLPKACLV